jgi:hypothetical protein
VKDDQRNARCEGGREQASKLRKEKTNPTQVGPESRHHPVTASRIENGHSAAIETVEKVASVLGVDAEWILDRSPMDVLWRVTATAKSSP